MEWRIFLLLSLSLSVFCERSALNFTSHHWPNSSTFISHRVNQQGRVNVHYSPQRSVNPLFMYSYGHLNNSSDSLSSESEEYSQVMKRNGTANNKKSQLIQTNSTVNEELSKCNDFVDDCCVVAQEFLLMKRSLKAELSSLIQVIQELYTYSSSLDFWLLMMQ